MYDIIIIGGGASGLFCSISAPKDSKKLIIERQESLGNKILLSGGGRCNFTNLNINPDRYFGQNKKMLASVFHKYSNYDFMDYLDENGIKYNVEDNGRVILKSGKAKELLDFLIEKSKENNTEIQTGQTITRVEKENDFFKITTEQTEFLCKKLVISTGGISYPQIGATSFGINIAKQFGLRIVPSFPALCGLETKEDFSSLSGSSITGNIELFDGNKKIYENQGNILFTHRGLSGPAIFNCSAGLAEYLTRATILCKQPHPNPSPNGEGLKSYQYPSLTGEGARRAGEVVSKQIENIFIKITPQQITKKSASLIKGSLSGFSRSGEGNEPEGFYTQITSIRPLEEAKVSSGGVDMTEIKPNFECKNIQNLYFIGETLDIIGETGGFNLQRARSSGAICGQNL